MSGHQLKLSKSDKKIASIVRAEPTRVIQLPIASLAREAGVSEPTVNRFCHKLGCEGYPDFKLKLAQQISSSEHLFAASVDTQDECADIIEKVIDSIEKGVRSIRQSINSADIEQATNILMACQSISFFGLGASGPVALDAQHKFFRFGIPVVAHTDFINQRMICSMLRTDDVAVFISYTGRTKVLIESATIAKNRGVPTIAITRKGSILANACDVVINAETREDTDLFTPRTSRIIQLALIDVLATSVAIKMGHQVEESIKAIKSNLRTTRYSNENNGMSEGDEQTKSL